MNEQKRFWQELYELKTYGSYLDLYYERTEFIDRIVSIAIALSSTTSLGAWAFLKQYDMLWAGIIVLSQLVAVAKGYLPYRQRLKALASCTRRFEELLIWAETKWFDVSNGSLEESEIVQARAELRKRRLKATSECFTSFVLPQDGELLERASSQAHTYFANLYGETTDDRTEEAVPA